MPVSHRKGRSFPRAAKVLAIQLSQLVAIGGKRWPARLLKEALSSCVDYHCQSELGTRQGLLLIENLRQRRPAEAGPRLPVSQGLHEATHTDVHLIEGIVQSDVRSTHAVQEFLIQQLFEKSLKWVP